VLYQEQDEGQSWSEDEPMATNESQMDNPNLESLDGLTEKEQSRTVLPRTFDIRYQGPGAIMQVFTLVLLVTNILTYVLFVVKQGNALFTTFLYTYDLPDNAPGTLLTTRFSFYFYFMVISFLFESAMLILCGIRVAIPWDNFYGTVHTIVAILAFVSEFATAIAMLVIATTVNTLGDPLNPANSEFFCAANSHPNNPALTPQGCPMPTNPYSIVVSASDLHWNNIFTNNFGFTWAMVFLTLVQSAIGLMINTKFDVIFNNVAVFVDVDNSTDSSIVEVIREPLPQRTGPVEVARTTLPDDLALQKQVGPTASPSKINHPITKMGTSISQTINGKGYQIKNAQAAARTVTGKISSGLTGVSFGKPKPLNVVNKQ